MGFKTQEIPTLVLAQKAGMKPTSLDEIEVTGEKISNVKRDLKKPQVVPWESISQVWGVKEM
jgi:hypothetical protein